MKKFIAHLGIIFLVMPLLLAAAIVFSPAWIPYAALCFMDWCMDTALDVDGGET